MVKWCVLAFTLCACSGGSTSPSSPSSGAHSTMFEGTIAGGGASGAFLATFPATGAVSGTLNGAGIGSVTLGGTYARSTGNVSLSGGGFTFTGTVDGSGGALSGSFTGPGNTSGLFSSLNVAQGSITPYCGSYIGNPDVGVFDAQVSTGGAISGESWPTNGHGSPTTFSGQLTGAHFTITDSEGNTGSGTFQNGTLSGTISAGPGGAGGTFAGSVCSSPPLPTILSVTITGSVGLGSSAALVATAKLSNGTTQNVTSQSIWQSSDTNVATVSPNNGYVTDVGLGAVVVTATYANGVTGADTIVFNPPAGPPQLAIVPGPNVTMKVGQSLQLTATAGWSGVVLNVTSLVSWSTKPGVTVSPTGLLTILPSFVVCNQTQTQPAPCPTIITVSYDGASNQSTFFVTP